MADIRSGLRLRDVVDNGQLVSYLVLNPAALDQLVAQHAEVLLQHAAALDTIRRSARPNLTNGLKPGRVTPPKPDSVKIRSTDRLVLLEPRGPNNPLPGSESWPVVEAREETPPALVPPAVRDLIAQLATAGESLDESARAAALDSTFKELTRRRAD